MNQNGIERGLHENTVKTVVPQWTSGWAGNPKRGHTDHIKSGFYRLAMEAGIPVGLGFIDYGHKRVGIERWITLSGDEQADLAQLRAYYADKIPLYPEKAGEFRFR